MESVNARPLWKRLDTWLNAKGGVLGVVLLLTYVNWGDDQFFKTVAEVLYAGMVAYLCWPIRRSGRGD